MRKQALPRVIVYNAVSLDGRIDGFTPDLAQFYSQLSIWKEDAVLAGSDTIIAACQDAPDDSHEEPPSVSRERDSSLPLLVVSDSRGRIQHWNYLRKQPYWRDAMALGSSFTRGDSLAHLQYLDVEYLVTPGEHVDYKSALKSLRELYGVKKVRVESGGTLNGVLLKAGLVDEVSLLVHPVLAGDKGRRSFFSAPELTAGEVPVKLRMLDTQKLENDVLWLRYEVVK